ncbi:hypothetical protein SLS58_006419 [Diplodia intermedia]|uniref:Uncharacterized protein n=1 Tax=Diplodia intermedia TaxID=856260 RepID=A0ABR3TNJ8_9PEZI
MTTTKLVDEDDDPPDPHLHPLRFDEPEVVTALQAVMPTIPTSIHEGRDTVNCTDSSAAPPDTSNDNENQDEMKPSNAQFHPTVLCVVVPTIPTSIQAVPSTMNPDLHCNNLVKPGGQPKKEMPEDFHCRAGYAGYGDIMDKLSSPLKSHPSLPSQLASDLPPMPVSFSIILLIKPVFGNRLMASEHCSCHWQQLVADDPFDPTGPGPPERHNTTVQAAVDLHYTASHFVSHSSKRQSRCI